MTSRTRSKRDAQRLEPHTGKVPALEVAKVGLSLYTIHDAAKILRLKPTWLYERTRKNTIPYHRFGKYIRFTEADLEAIVRMSSQPQVEAGSEAAVPCG
jgi:excisionase family DNA binding protein